MLHMIWNTFAVMGALGFAIMAGAAAGFAIANIINRRKAKAPDQQARFCAHCEKWIEEADRKRFNKGAKLWAAMCDPCIDRVSGVWTDNGTPDV